MKVVINTCYGGFGLSYEGMVEYAKRKGITLHAFVNARTEGGHINWGKYVPYKQGDDTFFISYSSQPLNDKGEIPKGSYLSNYDIKRDDPDLVAVVEALGEKADGQFANLTIVEIPDDVQWEIDEYDGYEHVDEVHRSWS